MVERERGEGERGEKERLIELFRPAKWTVRDKKVQIARREDRDETQ